MLRTSLHNNSRQMPHLSFYKIPVEPTLRKKWLKLLKIKGFYNPGPNHQVCSAHFTEGKKTYENNIPTVMMPETSQTVKRENVFERNFKEVAETMPNAMESISSDHESRECMQPVAENLQEQLQLLQKKHDTLQEKHDTLQKKYNDDMKAMEQQLFRMERFIGSDHDFRFYTGFPNYSTFKVFFDFLSPACNSLIYYGSSTGTCSQQQKKRGKPRSISPGQELFMVLVRLRCGLLIEDLAHRYSLSSSHVSRIWITWLAFLHQQLRMLPIWASRKFVDDNMPDCFKQTYPQTRVIIDCTEIHIEMPSSCRSQSVTFSNYKHHNTAKGLLGISPNGYPSFVSNLYGGRTSD